MTAHEPERVRRKIPARTPAPETIDIPELQSMDVQELLDLCEAVKLEVPSQADRHDIITLYVRACMERGVEAHGAGVLEVLPDGFGFLRSEQYDYDPGPEDIYISPSQIRRFGLQHGNHVEGQLRPPKGTEKYFALLKVGRVDGDDPELRRHVVPFEDRKPCYPSEPLRIETGREPLTNRVIDLLAPIGKGQRGLIVAPPKAGKTVLLRSIASGILQNHPELHLIVLLVDERPEEVTEMEAHVQGRGAEVIASTFDESSARHVHTAMMALEKAKRLAEEGKDVAILLDSITRLARAHNVEEPSSGKLLSGGMDPAALHKPKRFFGAARKLEGEGSLTILATALVDTGSRMDEVIFEEVKGTGNLEIVLDRGLADRRI